MEIVGPLFIEDDESLVDLDFPSLSKTEFISIYNCKITSLDCFSKLQLCTGGMGISYTDVENMKGLDSLYSASVFYLQSNYKLTSLDGLDRELEIINSLLITENFNLVDCEILCILSQTAGSSVIYGNGAPCNENVVKDCINKLKGKVFYDENRNGILDLTESTMENIKIFVQPLNLSFLTNEKGIYNIFLFRSDENEQTISVENEKRIFDLTTNFEYFDIKYSELENLESLDFGLIHNGNIHDITSNISSFAPRCNEEVEFKLKLINLGSYIENGKVIIRYDGYNDFTGNATPRPDQIDTSKHLLYYNYENFRPFEIKEYRFTLKMPGVESIDKFISNSGVIYNVVDGDTSLISHCNLREQIQCSFDPNDKKAYPPGVQDENYTLKSDTLRYRIRFQNTGNAEAYDITVRDTLSEYLDMSTFKILASSHPVQTSIARSTSREIAFVFEDIHLPDSTSNPEGSHGYVMYEILPKKNLPENTMIENTAFIYFDYNPAIVTNTAFNTMVTTIPMEDEPDEDPEDKDPNKPIITKVTIAPNPTNTYFKVSIDSDEQLQIVLTDMTGKIVKKMKYQKDEKYPVGEILSGLYFVNIVDVDNDTVILISKLVILK